MPGAMPFDGFDFGRTAVHDQLARAKRHAVAGTGGGLDQWEREPARERVRSAAAHADGCEHKQVKADPRGDGVAGRPKTMAGSGVNR